MKEPEDFLTVITEMPNAEMTLRDKWLFFNIYIKTEDGYNVILEKFGPFRFYRIYGGATVETPEIYNLFLRNYNDEPLIVGCSRKRSDEKLRWTLFSYVKKFLVRIPPQSDSNMSRQSPPPSPGSHPYTLIYKNGDYPPENIAGEIEEIMYYIEDQEFVDHELHLKDVLFSMGNAASVSDEEYDI